MRSPQRLPRAAAWALLALAVLGLHVWLLGALLAREAADATLPAASAMPALRVIALPAAMATPTVPLLQPSLPPPPVRPAGAPPRHRALPVRATPLSEAVPATANEAAQVTPLPRAAAADTTTAAAAAHADAARLPLYATRLPPNANLYYRAQRGDAAGSARVQWQHDAAGAYWLRLDTAWPGQPASGSTSRGRIDGNGVAPQRHADIRRAREVRAANFQREAARITFSGPQLAYALPPGAQDRLSWMVQLAAIVDADAELRRAGARITLFVVGARGDADAWHFEVLGAEPLALPVGAVADALHLKREPTRPYDTRVEVWLDPARQHLPVRALLTTLPGGQPLQLELAPAPDSELEIGAAAPR